MGLLAEDALKQTKAILVLLAILVAIFYAGYAISAWKADSKYELLLGEKTALIKELKIVQNKTRSLDSVLSEKGKEAEELKQIIKSLEEREPEIKYIVKTKTVFKSKKPEKVFVKQKCELPDPYVYELENGLPVASFEAKDKGEEREYKHKTADIKVESAIVISDDKTGVTLKAESSLNPNKKYLLKVDNVQVTRIRQHKIFEPHLQIGLTASLDFTPIRGDLTAYLSMPLFHLMDRRLDLLAPKIAANNSNFRVGLDIVSYNIGYDLPVITDLWISLGTTIPLISGSGVPSIDLSIGSKF